KDVLMVNLLDRTKIVNPKSTAFSGDKYSYRYRFSEELDKIMVRPNFEGRLFIWIDLTDENLKLREELERSIFSVSTPVSMEIGWKLNDRNVRTPNDTYLDK